MGQNFFFIYSGSVFVNVQDTTATGEIFYKTVVVMSKGESFGVSTKIKMPASAFFILFHHFYTEKHVYVYHVLRITASGPVGHAFVWLPHLQLKYHLNFIDNLKHVKKYKSFGVGTGQEGGGHV